MMVESLLFHQVFRWHACHMGYIFDWLSMALLEPLCRVQVQNLQHAVCLPTIGCYTTKDTERSQCDQCPVMPKCATTVCRMSPKYIAVSRCCHTSKFGATLISANCPKWASKWLQSHLMCSTWYPLAPTWCCNDGKVVQHLYPAYYRIHTDSCGTLYHTV